MSVLAQKVLRVFTRRKPIEPGEQSTNLNRCLGPIDLTALGVGSTLGVGIYVIIGTVAANDSGPSVVISFFIGAICSIFAGLCYAEFGALVPKAGSAYIYSYISIGELMAYVIGWNLILEYVIATASVARSYSNYLDFLVGNKIQDFFMQYIKLPKSEWFSSYPDVFAFTLTMLLTIMLTIGVKESTRFTTIFTGVNILVILYVIVIGVVKIDLHNWNLDPAIDIPANVTNAGSGGFLPFGIKGMVSGAATCFYSYVGFDAIATTGEEVINPQRDIPISIVLSLLIVSVAYCVVSGVQTLMWPYWDQDQKAPLPYVFDKLKFPFAKNVIAIGALAGLSTSLLGSMFPLPRILYAMACDGLLFRSFASINARFKTPVCATLVSGFFSALMATFFDVAQLAEMMSIGTLLAYSLVAISILILRYRKKYTDDDAANHNESIETVTMNNDASNEYIILPKESFIARILNLRRHQVPTDFSSKLSLFLIAVICIFILIFNVLLITYEDQMYDNSLPTWAIALLVLIAAIIVINYIFLTRQPMKINSNLFKVPCVPFIPLLSVFSNLYLMAHLKPMTWLRFLIWMGVGFLIYFTYSIRNSVGYMTKFQRDEHESAKEKTKVID